jgi:hypothetical protein
MRRPARLALTIVLAALLPALAACGSDTQGGPSTIPGTGAQSQPVDLTGVATTIVLDPLTVGVLSDNNISWAPIPPARRTAEGISFPITSGRVRPDSFAGSIHNAGGIALTNGRLRVALRDIVVNTTTGQLSADAGAGRVALMNLDFSSGKRRDVGTRLVLADIPATLSSGAAHALSEALNVSVFTPALPIGIGVITATQ